MQRDPERVSLHGGETNPDARVCDRASGKGGVKWEYSPRRAVLRLELEQRPAEAGRDEGQSLSRVPAFPEPPPAGARHGLGDDLIAGREELQSRRLGVEELLLLQRTKQLASLICGALRLLSPGVRLLDGAVPLLRRLRQHLPQMRQFHRTR